MSIKRSVVKKGHKSEREAWLEKLQFLSDAMEATSQPFAAGDPDGRMPIFNEAFCRLTGYSREELYALSWATDLNTAESCAPELEALEVLDRTHEPQRYEKVYIRKDGTALPVELFSHAAPDSQGHTLFYYTFITDISGHKRKEQELRSSRDALENAILERTEALRRSEERLRKMMEASPVPMVMFEGNQIIFLNRKFVETFGYTIEDMPTLEHWWPLAYPDEEYRKFVVRRWDTAIGPAIRNRTDTEPREVVVRCKDGSQKYILSYFSSIGDLNLSVFYDITERKLAEEKLAHMASFPELNTSPIVEINDNWTITYSNPASRRMFPDLIARGSDHPLLKGIRLGQNDTPTGESIPFVRDVEIGGAHFQQNVLHMPERRMTRVYCVDITERKRAEEALRESEAMLAKSQEMARIGSWFWDVKTGEISRSAESYSIFGLIPGEYVITFEMFLNFIVPEDREYVSDQTKLSLESGQPYDITYRIRRKDGAVRILHSRGEPVKDASGRIVKMYGTNQDVTERQRAEEALKLTQASVDGASEMVAWFTPDGKVYYANDAMCRTLGFSREELREMNALDFSPGFTREQYEQHWQEVRERKSFVLETVHRRKDGTEYPAEVLVNYVQYGGQEYIFAYGRDITGRKQADEELKAAKSQAELYLDLMGHDISNMHQIIMMQLELALNVLDEEGRLEEKDREMITTSVKTLDRSVNLINNVRMLQKVRSGDYRAEPLDLGHVIDDVLKIYSDIPGRDITINYAPSGGHMVMASPLIKDILGNLVDNAVKHSKDPVLISIDIGQVSYKGVPYYRVSVEDNGIGIPDEKKDLIFQRFKRGQTTAKGTGLGLYIVRTLVEGFGGYVRVEDRVRGDHAMGARFLVYLPVAEVGKNE